MARSARITQLGLLSLYGLALVWSPMFGTTEALVFPDLYAYPDALLLSRICNLAAFGVVMGLLSAFGERIRAFYRHGAFMGATAALGVAGMLLGAAAGMGFMPQLFLVAGAAARGLFYGAATLLWIDVFVHLDDGTIGTAVAASLIVYAVAGCLVMAAAAASPWLAAAALVACPIGSCLGYLGLRGAVDTQAPIDQESTTAPFLTRCLLYAANFAYGIMFGGLLHYFAFYDTPLLLGVFLGMAGILFALFACLGRRVQANMLYRAFMMGFALVAAIALLLGHFGQTAATIVSSAALAFLILYTVVIFTDTQARLRKPFWKVPGMCQVFAVLGMILASALFEATYPTGGIGRVQLALLASACIIFVAGVFSPSNATRQRPWGFSSLIPAESPEAHLLRRCGELAQEHGLTSRELEVLQQLAVGMTKDQIAESLFISPATAKTHTRNIYAKLGVHSQRELEGLME